jgi:branched-chain amino acid transport system permease protein
MTAAAVPPMAAFDRQSTVRVGLLAGIVALYLCLVGIVEVFSTRDLISGVISLGQTAIVLAAVAAGALANRGRGLAVGPAALAGLIAGGIAGVFPGALMAVSNVIEVRAVFLHASPVTWDVLTLGLGPTAIWIPVVAMALIGAVTGALVAAPSTVRRPITAALLWLLAIGLFAGLLRPPLLASPLTAELGRFLFASDGVTVPGAVITLIAVLGGRIARERVGVQARVDALTPERRRALRPVAIVIGLLFVLWLPQGVGSFFAQVVAVVALYVLMGLGLNITLGLAGLLDLGFVAFFAVGAYTVGLLTSTAEYGIAQWPFWAAVPFAVIIAMAFGAFFGLPILGIRGDYLAIATLGFGEIIRILAGSDLLKSVLGGPRGIINIPHPINVPPDSFLAGPLQIYYIALVAAGIVAFVAIRLRASRLGRAWLAIREDEDVAEALGINLVRTKLLAYMLGAAFAGLGGAIFAGLLGSIFASSVTLFVSINVAALIIVGGMGSIPGVVVGAIFLIGVPELFREFSEYRYLFYGIALIAMMIYRPEGLLPSRIIKRELHVEENVEPALGGVAAAWEPAPPVPGSRGSRGPGSRP